MASSSLDISQIEELLNCPVCFDAYKNPRNLICGHQFCEECLRSIKERNPQGNIICPTCREETILSGDVVALPRAITISQLKEKFDGVKPKHVPMSSSEDAPKAVVRKCEERNCEKTISMKCKRCVRNTCDTCAEKHKKLKHEVEEVPQNPELYCENHPMDLLSHYCTSCQVCICEFCLLDEHESHDNQTIKEASDILRKRLCTELDQSRVFLLGVDKEDGEINIQKEKLRQNTENFMAKANEKITAIEDLKTKFKKHTMAQDDALNTMVHDMSLNKKAKANQFSESAQTLLETYPDEEDHVIFSKKASALMRRRACLTCTNTDNQTVLSTVDNDTSEYFRLLDQSTCTGLSVSSAYDKRELKAVEDRGTNTEHTDNSTLGENVSLSVLLQNKEFFKQVFNMSTRALPKLTNTRSICKLSEMEDICCQGLSIDRQTRNIFIRGDDDNIYIYDYFGNRLSSFQAPGYLDTDYIPCMGYDTKRNFFLVPTNVELIILTKNGTEAGRITLEDCEELCGAAYLEPEDLYVVSDNKMSFVALINPETEQELKRISHIKGFGRLERPCDVTSYNSTCDDRSVLVITDVGRDQIVEYDVRGQSFIKTYGKAGKVDKRLRHPYSSCVDPVKGKVYVCDKDNHRILAYESFNRTKDIPKTILLDGDDFQPNSSCIRRSPVHCVFDPEFRLLVVSTFDHYVSSGVLTNCKVEYFILPH